MTFWYQWTPIDLPINVLQKKINFGWESQKLKFASKMPVASTKILKLSWSYLTQNSLGRAEFGLK